MLNGTSGKLRGPISLIVSTIAFIGLTATAASAAPAASGASAASTTIQYYFYIESPPPAGCIANSAKGDDITYTDVYACQLITFINKATYDSKTYYEMSEGGGLCWSFDASSDYAVAKTCTAGDHDEMFANPGGDELLNLGATIANGKDTYYQPSIGFSDCGTSPIGGDVCIPVFATSPYAGWWEE